MLLILINGKPTQIGADLPEEIVALSISYRAHPMMPVGVPSQQVPLLKAWLNKVINNCTCTHLSYNNILMEVADCTLFSEEELDDTIKSS